MAKQFPRIEDAQRQFIARQRIFFAASAAAGSRINLSPRSTDLLRVIDAGSVVYLDRTGSGNETAAHMLADGRLTFMFCAFEGPPLILRLYGCGRILERGGNEYATLLADRFDDTEPHGARQMVLLDVELVQTSCGFGVPFFAYEGERKSMDRWADAKSEAELAEYRQTYNQRSIDGLPTGLLPETESSAQ